MLPHGGASAAPNESTRGGARRARLRLLPELALPSVVLQGVENRFSFMLALLALVIVGALWLFMPTKRASTRRFRGSVPLGDSLRFRRCTRDDECVAVQNGCCDCNNGSPVIAVRRDMRAEFRSSFSCSPGCTEKGGPPCWEGKVLCESDYCEFVWAHGSQL